MDSTFWAFLLKPFILIALFALVLIPARLAVQRYMRDGKLKRLFMMRLD